MRGRPIYPEMEINLARGKPIYPGMEINLAKGKACFPRMRLIAPRINPYRQRQRLNLSSSREDGEKGSKF